MFMFITSVLKCIEVILFCGCSFCAYRSWLTLMHVLHLSMPTVHLNAFRRRRWHECHCPSCLIKYAGNAGRRGLHAQGRHLHPSLERGSLNTLLVLRALEFFVLQSLSGFCVFVCTESKASMYHGVGQPNFGPKLGGDFMVENSTGENQDRRTGTGPWQSAEMSDSTRGLVPCDPNFSKYASLQSDVAQLKMHRSTIGTLDVSICFNMFQYVSICFNMFQYVSICFNMFQYSPGVWTCSFHWGLEYQLRAAYWPFHPREREYNALPNNLTFLFTSEVDAATSSFDLPGRLDDIFQSAKLHTLGRSPYSSPLSPWDDWDDILFTDVARVTELAQVSNVPIIPREVLYQGLEGKAVL